MNKPKIVKDYDKLSSEVKEQIKLVYPKGYAQHLVSYTTKDGEIKLGLPFETDEIYYLIRMSVDYAESIIEKDSDFDLDGNLKDNIKEKYSSKYDDIEYLESNANEDNDFYDEESEDD